MTKGLKVLDSKKIQEVRNSLRALEHDLRMEILQFIDENPNTFVKNIYKTLDLEQSVTSQHLKILKDAGIVNAKREGKHILYTVNYDRLAKMMKAIDDFLA